MVTVVVVLCEIGLQHQMTAVTTGRLQFCFLKNDVRRLGYTSAGEEKNKHFLKGKYKVTSSFIF